MQYGRSIKAITAILCLSTFVGASFADGSGALKKSPGGANAVMTINVAKLIESPMGKSAQLQSKLIKGYPESPLAVPASAQNVTLVAGVHPMGMESIWQVAIVELANAPRLDAILAAQGGYVDTVEGKPAAWSKHDIYYVQLDQKTVGVVRPGQRQFVSRWLTAKDPAASPYLSGALTSGADAHVVFAIDMNALIAPPAMRYALAMGELPSLEALEPAQQAKLVAAVATIKGMTITMRAAEKLDAEWVIEFGQDVSALGNQAGPLVTDALSIAGLNDGNAAQWDFKVDKNRIVGKGAMDFAGLSRLIGLLAPGGLHTDIDSAPAGGSTANAATPAGAPGAEPKSPEAAASQMYYRAVSKSLDSMAAKGSPTQGAVWLNAQKKQIEQLPILHVDPALLAWGNQVVEAYRLAAQELALGQQKAQNAATGIASADGGGEGFDAGANHGDSAADLAAYRDVQRQRRQAAQAERVQAADRALRFFDQIPSERAKLRAEMTQKYGVEF